MFSTLLDRASRAGVTTVAAVALLLGGAVAAQAQQGTVAGRVIDQSSLQALVGAQVYLPGTQLGTLTDKQGNYRIAGVPAGAYTLRVRLLGYQGAVRQITVQAGQTVTVNFQLAVSAVSLQEVVVTATGAHQTRSLGTNISTLDVNTEVQKTEASSIQDVLQGHATGVTIRQSSGSVGTGSDIKIRGPSSLSLGTTPLLYIDGVAVNNNNQATTGMGGNFYTGGQQATRWNDINPNDIQSINVLKGPAAVTLYGPGAAGGVILITTKHGAAGQATRYHFRAQVGGNWDATGSNYQQQAYDPLTNFVAGASTYQSLFGFTPRDTVYIVNMLTNSPGFASPFRTGLLTTYAGSMSGSAQPFNYYFSAQYRNEQGNLAGNGVTEWNGRGNFTAKPNDKVTLDVSTGFTSNNTLLPQNDNNSSGYMGNAILGHAYRLPMFRTDPVSGGAPQTTCPLAYEASRDAATNSAYGGLAGLSSALCGTPQYAYSWADIPLTSVTNDVQRFTGASNLTYRPLSFWTNRLTVGYDEFSTVNQYLRPVVPRLQHISSGWLGDVGQEHDHNQVLTLGATSTGVANLTEDITSTTTVGAQFVDTKYTGTYAEGRIFPPGTPSISASTIKDAADHFNEQKTLGIFGQQQFSWKDRLFLSGGIRADNNSAFGPSLGIQAVPQVSLSYVLSDEDWFPKIFDQFKIRGAWGQSTKQPPTNAAISLLTPIPVPFQGAELLGVTANRPGNDSLKPEKDTEFEAGADFSMLSGRLSGSFTWYHDSNKNAVTQTPLPPSSGYPGSQYVNVGSMVNKGIEAQLTAVAFDMPNLRWDWTVQASTNYNKITDLPNPIPLGFEQRHVQGYEFGSYYDRPVSFQNGQFVADTAQVLPGSPNPNFTGSISSTMTLFNHVTLYALVDYETGQQLMNDTQQFECGWYYATCPEGMQLTPSGTLTQHAQLLNFASVFGVNSLQPYMENAYWAKLRTVSLRVDLPQAWVRPLGAHGAAFTLVGNNVITWTGYSGADPELNGAGQGSSTAGNSAFVTDFLTLAPARRVTATVSVTF